MTLSQIQGRPEDLIATHPEVEFALVLARTIESIKSDPQQLRSAVYELARHKLHQLSAEDPEQREKLSTALEIAIAGVEAHTRSDPGEIFSQLAHRPSMFMPGGPNSDGPALREPNFPAGSSVIMTPPAGKPTRLPRWSSSTGVRFAAMLMLFVGIGGILWAQKHGVDLATARRSISELLPPDQKADLQVQRVDEAAVPLPNVVPEPQKPTWIPTTYGVYADSGGKLHELQMLSGRAPDMRIAVSAAILKPSETSVPDGHLRFIVFRRDMSGAGEPADVRVVARVKQVQKFDPKGKAVVAPGEDSWVIRNVSIPYRTGPLKEDPQMYEILPRDPDVPLPPGRYALVVKNQAFDFTVEGPITDQKQCLERLSAANGVFYSECQVP